MRTRTSTYTTCTKVKASKITLYVFEFSEVKEFQSAVKA